MVGRPIRGRLGQGGRRNSRPSRFCFCFEKLCGTRGRTRTGTLLRAGDFESPVSTNFTTLALLLKQGGDYSSDRSVVNKVY